MLFTFLVFLTKQKPLTYAKKIIDSLINDKAFRAINGEKLGEKKPPGLDTPAIVDALVAKGRTGVGVLVGPYDVDLVGDGDILRLRVDMIM